MSNKLGTHVIGLGNTWRIVGDVPAKLAYITKDGKAPTEEQLQAARHAGPGIAGLKTRTFRSKRLAELAIELVSKTR